MHFKAIDQISATSADGKNVMLEPGTVFHRDDLAEHVDMERLVNIGAIQAHDIEADALGVDPVAEAPAPKVEAAPEKPKRATAAKKPKEDPPAPPDEPKPKRAAKKKPATTD